MSGIERLRERAEAATVAFTIDGAIPSVAVAAPELIALLDAADAARYARAVATIWRDDYLRFHHDQPQGHWGIGTHPLALVLAAFDGETNPAQLGCEAERLRAALDPQP